MAELVYLTFHSFYNQNDCSEIVSGIDEGQFFDDIGEKCPLAMAGKVVIVAAMIGKTAE